VKSKLDPMFRRCQTGTYAITITAIKMSMQAIMRDFLRDILNFLSTYSGSSGLIQEMGR
jgi:hypothetical protein